MASGPYGDEKSCATYETFGQKLLCLSSLPPPPPFVGTSMATPIVAGAAIILREYFLEHYRTLCVSAYQYCKAFAPSGDSP
jgi:hypothetical protein